jgi:putative RNA 2'-phosphotransferase
MRKLGPEWIEVNAAALVKMIESSPKKRFEIRGGQVRAMYGHSISERIQHAESLPPYLLFHGTSPAAWEIIRVDGLLPMKRQKVHLSRDVETSILVGRRKSPRPVVLVVQAREANSAGTSFYVGNDETWLADPIPPQFISPLALDMEEGSRTYET